VPIPANFLTSRKAKEIEAAQQAARLLRLERQEAELAAAEEERRKLSARLAALPPESREALFSQARKDLLREAPSPVVKHYLKTNPEALAEDGPIYNRMRRMLSEGWQPQPAAAAYK
jgi:hypothetical protein